LTNDLRRLVADTLLNPNAKIFTCLDQEQVRLLIKQETMNERNWAYLVYALLILELWLQKENKGF